MLHINGGNTENEEINQEIERVQHEQKKLIKSILSKSKDLKSFDYEIPLNKYLSKLYSAIKPILTDRRFLKVLRQCLEPLPNNFNVADFVNRGYNPIKKRPSLIFADAFKPEIRRANYPRVMHVEMTKEDFASLNEVLTNNHDDSPEGLKKLQLLKELRRQGPFETIEAFGPKKKLGIPQLSKKFYHKSELEKALGISLIAFDQKEPARQYLGVIEHIFNEANIKQTLIIHESGRMNEQEDAFIAGDRRTLAIISFEDNVLYEDQCFITSHTLGVKAFGKFVRTGEVGLSFEAHVKLREEEEKIRIKKA